MPAQDAARRKALRFTLTALAWILGLFGAGRVPSVEAWVLEPLTSAQASLAAPHLGGVLPVAVTSACSGADVLAITLAATLAYPVGWRRRIAGALLGTTLILALNTLRIATLGRLVDSNAFEIVHVYLWPGALILAAVVFIGIWMVRSDERTAGPGRGRAVRFGLAAAASVAAYAAAAPTLFASEGLALAARGIGTVAVGLMRALGLEARLEGAVLTTHGSAFMVTPECIVTPLMPIYAAAILCFTRTPKARVLGLLGGLPLFGLLAVARLLTLAVPAGIVGHPLVFTHAFYQNLLAIAFVLGAAWAGRPSSRAAIRFGLLGLAAGALALMVGLRLYEPLLVGLATLVSRVAPHALTELTAAGDTQGALLLLPAFQIALFVALAVAGPRRPGAAGLAAGFGLLAISQVVLLVLLGEAAAHGPITMPIAALRAWALAGPALAYALVAWRAPAPTASAASLM